VTAAPHLRLADTVLHAVRGHNAFETTVEQIATAIRLGVFVDGEQLPPERELAERLGVSRTTLREAIAALRVSGFVQTRRGRGGGTVVTYAAPSPGSQTPTVRRGATLLDALDFRRIVEPGAAWLAATRELSRDQRDWLGQCLVEATGAPDDGARRMNDSRLHLAVATLSGSPMLIESVTRAQAALGEMLRGIPVLRRNIDHSDSQHVDVVDAVLRGDPDRAREAMEHHCDATSALLRGLIG
jgi:GntR family transcriptional repressor for pyruvate dehydrogenase complex